MMGRWLASACAAVVLIGPSSALGKNDYVYGPLPDWEAYKALGTPAVLAKMPDPQHWSVEWPNGYYKYKWRHKGRFDGYLSCGVLRATGPVQDKRQRIQFVIVVDHGVVKTVDISQRMSNSIVNGSCASMIEQGLIPPAPEPVVSKDHGVASLGIAIREMPEGAYITNVDDGAGKRAGLTPGTLVTRVNGIALAGMGPAMVQVLGSNAAVMTIETAAGGLIQLRRAP